MSNLTETVQEILEKRLHQNGFEVTGVIPIPSHADRMVKLRTLEEILDESGEPGTTGSMEYIIQIKPKDSSPQRSFLHDSNGLPFHSENIYLPNGKPNVSFLLKNAEILFESGDFALARNIFTTILQSGDYTSGAHCRIAECFEAESKLDEAKFHYEKSVIFHPNLEAYQNLAMILLREGNDLESAEVLERALNIKELNKNVRLELHKTVGNRFTRAKKFSEAEKHFLKALQIDPAADDVRSNLGALCLQDQKIVEAKRHFHDALASHPKNPQALAGLASCHLSLGEIASAHDLFVQSLEIELNNPIAIFYLVNCAYELKSYATAARLLEAYIGIAPTDINLLHSLAGLHFHLGRMSEAETTVGKILEIYPQHEGAKELLVMIERFAPIPRRE